MAFWKRSQPVKPDQPAAEARVKNERRRQTRTTSAIVSCDLGPIVNISGVGLAVRVDRLPALSLGAQMTLELHAPTESVPVTARVARVNRVSGGRFEIGLEFVGLSASESEGIVRLAECGSTRGAVFKDADLKDKLIAAFKLPDYYSILGLTMSATADDVHAAFRSLARKYHPDLNSDPEAHRLFLIINEAHAVLGDSAKRAEYDALMALRKAA